MLSGSRAVLSSRVSSSWRHLRITFVASLIGTFMNRQVTSKLARNFPGHNLTSAMVSTKCLEFLMNESVEPARGEMSWAMCLANK